MSAVVPFRVPPGDPRRLRNGEPRTFARWVPPELRAGDEDEDGESSPPIAATGTGGRR